MNINLPPDMLKDLKRASWPRSERESSVSGTEDNARVYGDQHNAPRSVMEFHAKPESWFAIGSGVVILLLGLWSIGGVILSGNVVEVRRGLFAMLLWLWLPFSIIKSLFRRVYPERRSIVTLDTERLIRNKGRDAEPKSICYEQICNVKSPPTGAGPVEVKYYEYDEQSGALKLSHLRSITLPETENDASLCYELRRRSFAPAPSRQARIGLVIWQCWRLALMLLAVLLYVFVAVVIAAVIAAIVT